MTAEIFDARACTLGEGPLWHPERAQLFWFDILGKTLLSQHDGEVLSWNFDECVSAAGWIDANTLLIASETGLWQFDLISGERALVAPLEAEQPLTRSNDGRADPWGGFWIGTMGFDAERGMGAIYRFYKGELRKLFGDITISNSIAFSPDRRFAYYTDTPTRQIMRVALDAEDGWPEGDAEVFVDLKQSKRNPDGSVVDSEGCLWNAQWGAGQVVRYGPDGTLMGTYDVPAAQATCPAFGGPDLKTVFVTSAAQGRDGAQDGQTFSFAAGVKGQREYRIIL
ncbi:SMP-30/gluconolactonase/LRE family protein [Sulfitobacter sp. AS59]|uniref:SMP-30/gluconolactonase/LRE family protein n=1 Tax=Sulfitobacter sp. AS59 TaxID=3135784 RepID=UPI0031760951